MKINQIRSIRKNQPQLILSNGSERSDYINMDHIFSNLGEIHSGIQLMKTYYPHDNNWSPHHKISEITKKENINYAWDYDYEDYHPFDLLESKSVTKSQINQIKCFGSDLHLTLTIDLGASDQEIQNIVRSLSGYGRVYLRINHEANGSWFRYNKLHTRKEVSNFFIRFHKIMKSESTELYSVFNLSGDVFMGDRKINSQLLYLENDNLGEALEISDFWSIDKYSSLHYAWPFQESIKETNSGYFAGSVDEWWQLLEETYLQMIWHNNMKAKPLFISEFNSDSDVDGFEGQAKTIHDVYNRLATSDYQWIAGIVMYQYRDYGGLGLEKGNLTNYFPTPALKTYKNEIKKFRENFSVDFEEWPHSDFTFSWFSSDEKKGILLSQLSPNSTLVNKFDYPIFLKKTGDNTVHQNHLPESDSNWIHLQPNQEVYLDEACQVVLFIPPSISKTENVVFTHTIRDLKLKLEHMFSREEVFST